MLSSRISNRHPLPTPNQIPLSSTTNDLVVPLRACPQPVRPAHAPHPELGYPPVNPGRIGRAFSGCPGYLVRQPRFISRLVHRLDGRGGRQTLDRPAVGVACRDVNPGTPLDVPYILSHGSRSTRMAADSKATRHQPAHPRRVAHDSLPAIVLVCTLTCSAPCSTARTRASIPSCLP